MRVLLDTIRALSSTRIPGHTISILEDHVRRTDARDLSVEIPILLGRPKKRYVSLATLRSWANAFVGDRVAPDVLEAAYAHVRNTSAAIALLVSTHRDPHAPECAMSTSELIAALDACDSEDVLRSLVSVLWNTLSDSRILNDILLGRHTHWCTESQLATAIANVNNLDRHAVVYELHTAHRIPLTAHRAPHTAHRAPLTARRSPHPFMLPHQSTHIPDSWLDTSIWANEPKYDGMRAQAVITDGEVVLWSMHGDIIDVGDAVVAPLRSAERDLIVDGELVDNRTRYVPFDLLDVDGIDLRHKPYAERRTLLHALVPHTTDAPSEGTVYKRLDSRYTAGTEHTDWYAVRFPRTVITCMLMYAIGDQFTFGVLHKGEVVNVVQLSRGIPQRDQERLLAYVRDHQTGRDGPARLVAPGLLARISYTTLHPAPRRKLGVKLNSPRWEGLGGETLSEL